MRFTKMQGLGNDFLVIDDAERAAVDWSGTARFLCDRRRGVGGDGLLILQPPLRPGADLALLVVNADGTPAQMCGNGVRCAAVLAAERGLAGPSVTWETAAGPVRTEVLGGGAVRVDMGVPRLAPADIPVAITDGDALHLRLSITLPDQAGDLVIPASAVGMGNPHCVVVAVEVPGFAGPLDTFPVDIVGPLLERHPAFPQRTNVEVVEVVSRSRIRQRTHERGVGETDACGTGACASVVALRRRGLVDASVDVELRGGILRVEWDGAGPVITTGPAAGVFVGDVALPPGLGGLSPAGVAAKGSARS